MPLTATCPNPDCSRSLRVPDHYAGKKGKCPGCGGIVAFPAPPPTEVEEILEEAESLPADEAEAEPEQSQDEEQPQPLSDVAPLDFRLIGLLAGGMFFLLLYLLSTLFSYYSISLGRFAESQSFFAANGLAMQQATVLASIAVVVLLLAAGTCFFQESAAATAGVGSAFGLFLLLNLTLEMIIVLFHRGSPGSGMILGLVASFFMICVFVTLAALYPGPAPFFRKKSQGDLLQRFGMLIFACSAVVGCFVLYLALRLIALTHPGWFA